MRGPRLLNLRGRRVAGRARTQQLTVEADPERNSLLVDRTLHFELVDQAGPDDFLVIANAVKNHFAAFGDMLGFKARAQGVVGVIVDGALRDVDYLAQLDLPVWGNEITPIPQAYGGYSVQSVNEPVICAGIEVQPGDLIVGDDDGVIVLPPAELAKIVDLCEHVTQQEAVAKDGISQGDALKDLNFNRLNHANAR